MKIPYTNNIFMTVNENGVVFDVLQTEQNSNKVVTVAKFGMSREHAKKFTHELSNLLAITKEQAKTGSKNKN
ncbi:hypothetical protein KKG52_02370 [Patescibacteria group bacterium]|nr:hypothetical protein [Patescibacteria group bacterium]